MLYPSHIVQFITIMISTFSSTASRWPHRARSLVESLIDHEFYSVPPHTLSIKALGIHHTSTFFIVCSLGELGIDYEFDFPFYIYIKIIFNLYSSGYLKIF